MAENSTEAPSRHITLEGAYNFRDLGGYETGNGRHVRWRTIFRADGLHRLTPGDLEVLGALGVATVLDLRSARELDGGRFPVDAHPVDFHHLPIVNETMDPAKYQLGTMTLGNRYEELAQFGAASIAEALRIMASPESHPVVMHCTVGKDRTGVLAALTLALLGVPDETIVADYALSAGSVDSLRERVLATFPERAAELATSEAFSTAPANMEWLLTRLREEHGSIEAYAAAAGAGADVVARLRDGLLE
jgi:protein-tyrosine phosphatase